LRQASINAAEVDAARLCTGAPPGRAGACQHPGPVVCRARQGRTRKLCAVRALTAPSSATSRPHASRSHLISRDFQ
jgi:hypothetical protein